MTRLRLLLAAALVVTSSAALVGTGMPASAVPVAATGAAVTLVADGIREPHTLRTAPDGRLFLLQQAGRVRVVDKGHLRKAPALKIDPDLIVEHNNSAGLLGIAFPPGFADAAVQHVYLLYTHEPMAGYTYRHNVVSRWVIEGNTIDPASEEVLIHLDPLRDVNGAFATSHYGGDMEFGADGKLYISTGDLYEAANGQDLTTRHGKILRYNADGTIPGDNPYYGSATGENRAIWASGVRNPFKLTFDARNGRLFIGDVGSTQFEEVNVLPSSSPGLNFGWSTVEGYSTDARFVSPLLAYPHTAAADELSGCAVMGGDVYRPRTSLFPGLSGQYLFADFCQGWVRPLDPRTGAVGAPVATGFHAPVDIAVTRNGTIWVAERQVAEATPGALFRIDPLASDGAPVITGEPLDVSVATGESAVFTVYASGSGTLSYQWYRDGISVPGATAASLTLPSVSSTDAGATFQVKVSNASGSTWSRTATLSVGANLAPTASISSPASGALFVAGEVLHLAGSGTDPEDGALPPSALTWEVDLHHNTHVHEVTGPVTGVSTLDVPLSRTIETDPDIFYRVRLTVRDGRGAVDVVTRDVLPQLTTFSVASVPSGTPLQVDGVQTPTPSTVDSVVGTTRTVGAAPVSSGGVTWTLDSWQDGSTTALRTFNAPLNPRSFLAFFRPGGGSVGTGTGLRVTYFADTALTDPVLSRVERVPYTSWPAAPVAGVPKDDFGVSWSGQLEAQFSGTYRFWASLNRDETLRVTVGGTVVVDASTVNGEVTGTVPLTAGQLSSLEIRYTDGNGGAGLDLTYGPDAARRSVLPGTQLYPSP